MSYEDEDQGSWPSGCGCACIIFAIAFFWMIMNAQPFIIQVIELIKK